MDVPYISALSALAGSVVGGLTSGVTTWMRQRAQGRAEHLIREMSRREELYKDFIVAASKVYGEAIICSEPNIQELIALDGMISRMRVVSVPRTVASADRIMYESIATYFAPNRTIRELPELMKSGLGIDPLKDFSEAARDELLIYTSP